MKAQLLETLWVAIVATVIAYGAFIYFGGVFAAADERALTTVSIQDTKMHDGSHRVSGMVMVPYECDRVKTESKSLDDGSISISFTTWQDSSETCPKTPTPQAFHLTLFVSDDTSYRVSLDGKALPTAVSYSNAID